MRFRTPRASEDGGQPSGMRFKMPSIRGRRSEGQAERDTAVAEGDAEYAAPRKHSMQGFLRSTGENLKAATAKIPRRRSGQKVEDREATRSRPRPQESRSMDDTEDVLDRIMGQSKEPKKASDSFWVEQRLRADSRQPSSSRLPRTPSYSKADHDQRPLGAEELREMYAGAPYFSVAESGYAHEPSVAFGRGKAADAWYGKDCIAFQHPSFAASTLRHPKSNPDTGSLDRRGTVAYAGEAPSMLSAHGNDTGTVGWDHYLQLTIADSTLLPSEQTMEKRRLLYTEPGVLGLQKLDMEYVVRRLEALGDLYATAREGDSGALGESGMHALCDELFVKLLSDNAVISGKEGRLELEIKALEDTLGQPELFHDFTYVEWRIRAGQLLWASQDTEEECLDERHQPSEMAVLLLQATLAAELLVRREVSAARESPGIFDGSKPDIAWSMVLAKVVLENLEFSLLRTESSSQDNRKSVFSALTYWTAKETEDERTSLQPPLTYPKKETTQLQGLLRFAEEIAWPHAQDVRDELKQNHAGPTAGSSAVSTSSQRPISMAFSIYATPLSSPTFGPATTGMPETPGTRGSYFGNSAGEKRPAMSRMTTAQSIRLLPASTSNNMANKSQSAGERNGGWLTRSWRSGLVLPGEAASHFLISTLLENSPQAIEALGDQANLYGGFLYAGRQFWSKSCVVGRVLAASHGASECMGWISFPNSADLVEGWINADVKEVPEPAVPRIQQVDAVSADSDPLHGHKAAGMQAGDFTTPVDGPPVMGNEVRCDGLKFVEALVGSARDEEVDASIAVLTFYSPINHKLASLEVQLTYDVHFISSYPCYPAPEATKPTLHATMPTIDDRDEHLELHHQREKSLPPPPAHPLHIDYHFTTLPVATLLSTPPTEGRINALSHTDETTNTSEQDGEVTILDCRGTAARARDLELLARAWCAKIGESAIVGKEGRTCLSCCVREARAVGVAVVIRI